MRFVGLGVFAGLLGLSGCCQTPPPVERYFNRRAPESALLGFVYAVDTDNLNYAYESLSSGTKEKISRGSFKLAVLFYEEPDFQTPIRDLLTTAISRRSRPAEISPDRAVVTVLYEPSEEDGIFADIVLERDSSGRWWVNLLETLYQLYGNRPDYVDEPPEV